MDLQDFRRIRFAPAVRSALFDQDASTTSNTFVHDSAAHSRPAGRLVWPPTPAKSAPTPACSGRRMPQAAGQFGTRHGRSRLLAAHRARHCIGVRLRPYRHEWPGPSAAGIAAVEPTGRYSRRVPAARAGTAPRRMLNRSRMRGSATSAPGSVAAGSEAGGKSSAWEDRCLPLDERGVWAGAHRKIPDRA